MLSELLLLSGNDIPFLEGRAIIHPPTLKEIGYIGEDTFFIGCGFLNFSKELLNDKDKIGLENYDDFDIFMSMIQDKSQMIKNNIAAARAVLDLIFPLYRVEVRNDHIFLHSEQGCGFINKSNFSAFKNILIQMFSLKSAEEEKNGGYKPAGQMAQRIAEKLKNRHKQLSKLKGLDASITEKKISILSRYASILSVGVQKDLNVIMQYTVYQLYDEFQRFQLKTQWDAYIQARIAGAQNLDEVDNWMIDLKDQGKNKKIKK